MPLRHWLAKTARKKKNTKEKKDRGTTWIVIAFRPVCCLLFLAEITFFALLGGKEEDLRKTKTAFLARFQLHLLGDIFYYKTGQKWHFWPKRRRQIGLMPNHSIQARRIQISNQYDNHPWAALEQSSPLPPIPCLAAPCRQNIWAYASNVSCKHPTQEPKS